MILEAVGRPICKKIRISSLSVIATAKDVTEVVGRYQPVTIDHDPDLCTCHQKPNEMSLYGSCVTPAYLRNKKSFTFKKTDPRSEASDVIEPSVLISSPPGFATCTEPNGGFTSVPACLT